MAVKKGVNGGQKGSKWRSKKGVNGGIIGVSKLCSLLLTAGAHQFILGACFYDSFEAPVSKKKLVYKANALSEAKYTLTAAEQKVILAAITQVRRDQEITDDELYTIEAADLSDITGFAGKHEYRNLKAAVDRIFNRYLTIEFEPNGGPARTRKIRWVQTADYIPSEGRVKLRFSKDILPFLNQLTSHFFSYKFMAVSGMRSAYGIRLYELLARWRFAGDRAMTGEKEIEIEWLRKIWQIENKYSSIKDLKKYVIERAAADVNEHSDVNVRLTYKKTGRSVTHIQIKWEPKLENAVGRLSREAAERMARPGESYPELYARLQREGHDLAFKM